MAQTYHALNSGGKRIEYLTTFLSAGMIFISPGNDTASFNSHPISITLFLKMNLYGRSIF